jgi:hypothetical protein
MTQAERQIRETLAAEFPELQVIAGARSTLEIPAAHDRVGPLYVQINPEEITVFVGPTHCHFEHYDDEPEDKHIAQALELIRGVLSDRIVLWSCLGAAGAYDADRESRFRLPWLVRRFLWSGPFPK